MKTKAISRLLAAGMLVLALCGGQAGATIIYNNPGGLQGNEQATTPLILGLDFTVVKPGVVTAVGAFDNFLNGFPGGPVPVAIYNVSSGLVVPGTQVAFSGPGGWDFTSGSSHFINLLNPVLLNPGVYSIVAANYGNFPNAELNYNSTYPPPSGTPPFFDSAFGTLAMGSGRTGFGASLPGNLNFPSTLPHVFSGSDPQFAAGTFDFTPVPEATTYGLAAVLLLGGFYFGRMFWLRRVVS
jgi:hypothetical protein